MAAYSVCPKNNCNNTTFELVVEQPKNSTFKINVLRCNMCGAVVGITDYYDVSDMVLRIAQHLKVPLK